MTLLMLPSVPLLRVLAMLEPKDLIAAGRASPRLGALTRANTSLWKESEVWDQDVMTLLQVIPPVDTLKAEVEPLFSVSGEPLSVPLRPRDASGTPDPTFSYPRYSGSVLVGRRSELVLKESKSCYYSEFIAVSLIWELAPRLKHLEVSQLELGIFLQFLESAFCLETLRIRNLCTYSKNASVPWPQDVRVPRLHTVSLSGRCPDRDVTALRSLLLAHRGQLRHVDLSDLSSPLPLLDACPDNLHRLGVKVEDAESCVAVAKTLHRMQGQLKELKMNFRFADADLVQDSLASWGGPLERLEFENYYPETLRVVGAGGLSGLQHLVLVRPRGDDPGEVSAALSGLPRLRSLVLRAGLCMLPPEAFLDIPAANPDLELLVVVGITKYNCLCLYKGESLE
ncbi:uncharacterized protein LOC113206719 [Frankliniella occidentalis]|uniref:Uncharacterized protein LOC113206719 n=1 Tax=Frankliniella occidentalis TaxID=133901 RepID=A0A9C6XAH7_FRAOC|nr:uncharacterized protein LOC113206719 [Frankliniella occidentalis]